MALPKNFYNAVDVKKMMISDLEYIRNKMDSIITLPPVTSEDSGKIMIVSDSGIWELSE